MENTNFKIYDVGNLGSGKSNLFIGNTYISDVTKNKNDFSTFLFASLVGGRNIRIDQATEKDPYIFIDARFYTFKPYNYYVSLSNNEPLSNLEATYGNTSDVYLKTIIKNITTVSGDVEIHIKNLEVDSKLTFYKNSTDNEIVIKAADYNLKNTTESKAIKILDSKQKDSFGNTSFVVRKLIEGNCLKLDQILEFTWEGIFSSSFSSEISSSSISQSFSSNSSSSSSSSSTSHSSSSISETCCDTCKVTSASFTLSSEVEPFDFEEVFYTFDRIAHGAGGSGYLSNDSTNPGTNQYFCLASEINDPNFAIPANGSNSPQISNANAWLLYNDPNITINGIYSQHNAPVYAFLMSPYKIENYNRSLVFSAVLNDGLAHGIIPANANNPDNDILAFVVAAWEDQNDLVTDPFRATLSGYQSTYPRIHTLSLIRSFSNQGTMGFVGGIPIHWSLVYDFNQSATSQVIYTYPITPTPVGGFTPPDINYYSKPGKGIEDNDGVWAQNPKGTRVSVTRIGSIITARCTDLTDDPDESMSLGYTITYDLNSNPITQKFIGPQKIGFGYSSQRWGTFTNNSCELYFDDITQLSCNDCLSSPREFIEANYRFNAFTQCIIAQNVDQTKLVFPENIYSPTSLNQYFMYAGTRILDSNNSIVTYSVAVNSEDVIGIMPSAMTYLKTPNLVQHDITLGSQSIIAPNNIEININPSYFLNMPCSAANLEIDSEIFDVLESMMTFTLETQFDGESSGDQIFTQYDFPADITNGVFIRDLIVPNYTNETYDIYYKVEDKEYNSGSTDGLIKIRVHKCLMSKGLVNTIGNIEFYVKTCCNSGAIGS